MFAICAAFIIAAFAATSVKAHGYVQDIVVGSTHYTGYLPYEDPYKNPVPDRVIRPIPGNGKSLHSQLEVKTVLTSTMLGPVEDVTLIE